MRTDPQKQNLYFTIKFYLNSSGLFPNNLIPFARPANYQPDHSELLARIPAKESWKTIHSGFTTENLSDGKMKVHHTGGFLIKNMPKGKTDFNNFGAFSTDMIGMNCAGEVTAPFFTAFNESISTPTRICGRTTAIKAGGLPGT